MTLLFLLSWDQDRSQQSNQQYSPHNAKRYGLGNVHPLFADHFSPDKNQDDRQSLIQEAQTVDDSRQQKVQRPKPQNREHIRCVHNERIASNAEHRGDGVHGQRDVRNLHHKQNQKQWSRKQPARIANEETITMILVAYSEMPAREAHDPALLRMNISLVKEEHARTGVDEERSQHIPHPGKMLD